MALQLDLGIWAIALWGVRLIKFWLFGELYLLIIPMTVVADFGLLAITGLKIYRAIWQKTTALCSSIWEYAVR